jgi:hypothetical protein
MGMVLVVPAARPDDVLDQYMAIKEWTGTFQITVEEHEHTADQQYDLSISINGNFNVKDLLNSKGNGLPLDLYSRLPYYGIGMLTPRVTWIGAWSGSVTVDREAGSRVAEPFAKRTPRPRGACASARAVEVAWRLTSSALEVVGSRHTSREGKSCATTCWGRPVCTSPSCVSAQ